MAVLPDEDIPDFAEPPIDDARDEGVGIHSYPLDTLLIRSEPRAIADVLRRISRGAIRLDPDFEREFVWDDKRQSRLIESVLMRIPLPVFYLAEDKDGSLIVVDGLQRLTTFKRFKNGDLVLNIPNNLELHGHSYDDLHTKLQDRFEDGPLTFYLIDPKVPDRVRLDIFDRVNSGVALTRQQMRNALYNGPATVFLRELSTSQSFQLATGHALSSSRQRSEMKDREAINRFLAFVTLGWPRYGVAPLNDYDEFLGAGLRYCNERSSILDRVKSLFLKSMLQNLEIFDKHAFRKSRPPGRRSALNLSLFDVFSVGLARYADRRITKAEQESIRTGLYSLLERRDFANSVSDATTRPDNVHERFRLTDEMLEGVLGAP